MTREMKHARLLQCRCMQKEAVEYVLWVNYAVLAVRHYLSKWRNLDWKEKRMRRDTREGFQFTYKVTIQTEALSMYRI
jgi:hypothetical protein